MCSYGLWFSFTACDYLMWLCNQLKKKVNTEYYYISHTEDNISPGWEENEITPESYGIGPVVYLHGL